MALGFYVDEGAAPRSSYTAPAASAPAGAAHPVVQPPPQIIPYPGRNDAIAAARAAFPQLQQPGSDGGGNSGFGGWSFDTNPGYEMALAQEQSGLSSIEANLKAARERAITGFGDPALASLAGFGLDPQAADFARQNYLSGNATLARLDKEKEDKRRAVINALAGHGILFSGETGYQEGEGARAYGTAVYDARNKVLDYLRDLDQQATDRKAQLRQMVIGALQNAYASGGGGYGSGGAGGGGGGYDPTDFQYGATLQGGTLDQLHQRAVAGAPAGAVPMHIMNQGMTQDGRVSVKYRMPDGTTSTFWVGADGSLVPA